MFENWLREAHGVLAVGTPLVLVNIMSRNGSAPRTAGTRMLVCPGGKTLGTVGGGRAEAEAVALAGDLLAAAAEKGAPADAIMRFSLAGLTDMDMICGGSLRLLFETILPGTPRAALLGEAHNRDASRIPFCRLTRITLQPGESVERAPCMAESLLFDPATKAVFSSSGGFAPGEELLEDALNAVEKKSLPHLLEDGDGWWFVEPFFPAPSVYIFGAGHVSVETAALTARVGFRTTVLDDRPELLGRERFPEAVPVVLPDLGEETVARYLEREAPRTDDAVVIITRGHAHDRDVLAAALCHPVGYRGMIGSRGKREGVYAALEKRGFAREKLREVHSPIGLNIGAETPEEIAVSIVAELIQWRRRA